MVERNYRKYSFVDILVGEIANIKNNNKNEDC